jgi:FMN phosphatase YigB (HAD superfamily)
MTASKIYKAIFFDLGGVLVDVDWAGYRRGLAEIGCLMPGDVIPGYHDDVRFIVEFMTGRASVSSFWSSCRSAYGWNADDASLSSLWGQVLSPFDYSSRLISHLTEAGLKLGIMSDTDPIHWETQNRSFEFLKRFEASAVSFELGVMKPDKSFPQYLMERLNVDSSECVIIDDKTHLIEGYKEQGFSAFHWQGSSSVQELLQFIGMDPIGGGTHDS